VSRALTRAVLQGVPYTSSARGFSIAVEIQPLRNVRSLAFHGRNQNS
jgi:hypothetical protein